MTDIRAERTNRDSKNVDHSIATDADTLLVAVATSAAAGRLDDALAQLRAALGGLNAMDPRRAPALHNLGVLLYQKGEIDEALTALRSAHALHPAWVEPPLALGHAAYAQRRFADAGNAFDVAAGIAPDRLDARFNAARAWIAARRYSLALPHLAAARDLAPANETVWHETQALLLLLRKDDEALADFLRYEAVAPMSPRLAVAGLHAARRMGDSEREARYLAAALAAPYAAPDLRSVAALLGYVQYADVKLDALLALYETYDRLQHTAPHVSVPLTLPRRRADTRIRVGYLSADFRAHVMGELLLEPIAAHDRARFEVHAYLLAPAENEDAMTKRWRAAVDGLVNVSDYDDRAAAQRIAADDIDLLVDLMGHSAFARPGILACKPAPVIVTHLGYHGAVGLREVDFKMTDAHTDTPTGLRYQLEDGLVMERCVLPLRPLREPGPPIATRAELGIAPDAIVFAAFVGVHKLSPRCLALWRRILDAVPHARLAFSLPHQRDKDALMRRLTGFGIPVSRTVFIPYRQDDAAANHARYALVDIALDTLPYTGGDTTAAALAAGIPVVTRVGIRHAERMTFSILAHLQLSDTVAESDDAYVDLAVRLASDRSFRMKAGNAIRRALGHADATDPLRYARSLENAYVHALVARRSLPLSFNVPNRR